MMGLPPFDYVLTPVIRSGGFIGIHNTEDGVKVTLEWRDKEIIATSTHITEALIMVSQKLVLEQVKPNE